VPRRPILLALLVGVLATVGVFAVVRATRPGAGGGTPDAIAVGNPAPAVTGTTLDGAAFDLKALTGRPVVINFWGQSCVPCRDEFPLLESKLTQHASDGIAVVGILTDDPPEGARAFIADHGATWPTVVDPNKAIKAAYRVAARPQTYFVDRAGVLRSIQVGELTDADFERQYAKIATTAP
jgi:cytochrome c biogenesis protein CcmG/thiol:disulfide interchange protein DsbE